MIDDDVEDLENLAIIGYDGGTYHSLLLHPDNIHIIYPIGNAVVIQNWHTRKQDFLRGHTNIISAVALSRSGKYVASGQINHMGFKATTILWDFEKQTIIAKYDIHKVRVEYVVFTCDDSYLISLGGRDDTCIVCFDIEDCEPMCGGYANGSSTGIASMLSATNLRGRCVLSGGDRTLRTWRIDKKLRKIFPTEIKFNKVKRQINCIVLDKNDEIAYCGTSSGDVAKVYVGYPKDLDELEPKRPSVLIGCFGKYIGKGRMPTGAVAECYSQGIRAIIILGKGELIIGAGDGTVEIVKERDEKHLNDYNALRIKDPTIPMLIGVQTHDVDSGVSAMQMMGDTLLVGTVQCEIYTINMKTWELKLRATCHCDAIYDVCFPTDYSEVFATCSKDTLRVWQTETSLEMLRIHVPNFTASAIAITHDGKSIVSSWNDGTIRAFTPITGRLMYIIHNAHNKGVSAMSITRDGKTIVSGGGEGQVRVWDIKPDVQNLRAVLQEHKAPVSAIDINHANDEAVSASTDGSCIMWDLKRCVRRSILFANSLFMAVKYHPSDCQVITAGTDRNVAYWETYDGSLIREIEASTAAGVNAVDITADGEYFATGGNDQMVKLWNFQRGIITHIGIGHAGIITALKFSPDMRYLVSVSSDGGIFRWKNPYAPTGEPPKTPPPVESVHTEQDDTSKLAKGKELDENILETRIFKCKCKKPTCTCPRIKAQKMKCKCGCKNCKCNIIVIKPLKKSPSDTSSVASKTSSKKSVSSKRSCSKGPSLPPTIDLCACGDQCTPACSGNCKK